MNISLIWSIMIFAGVYTLLVCFLKKFGVGISVIVFVFCILGSFSPDAKIATACLGGALAPVIALIGAMALAWVGVF